MDVREKLVKQAISHFWYGVSHDIFSEPVTTYAKLAIEALEKEKESGVTVHGDKDKNVPTKWISVKDRLPDLELVEVKTDDNDLFPCLAVRKHPRAKNGKYTAKVWYDGYGFIDGISNDVTDEITHWMPLPQPPKGER